MSDTILVVDDDPIILGYLEAELKRNFFTPICVGTGAEALAHLDEAHIVFLDLKLPDMDGFEILARIRERTQPNSFIETIVMTGFGSQEVAIRALRMGAIDYIEKPIQLESFRASLGRAQEVISRKMNFTARDTILVIDDEKEIAEKLKRILEKEGYQALCCFNGNEGLDIITRKRIDVVVTDINMKEMSGLELLAQAKKLFPDIEVIMMTGQGGQELAIQSLRAGAMDYLPKPVNLDQLLLSVQKAIEKMRLLRSSLYRTRELKLSAEVVAKMNEEQEKIIAERTSKLNQTQASLVQTSKLATLGEMSAGMAHELNQPLGGISLIAQTMKKLKDRKALTDEELEKSLNDINHCVKRMTKIIQHVRTFARQETLKFIEVNVNETVESAIMLLGEQLRLHGIELKQNLDPSLPRIVGEPYQLEQVWINLLGNARDALDELGERRKEAKMEYSKQLCVTTWAEQDTVLVGVSDNGIGNSRENTKKVFSPFFSPHPGGKGGGVGVANFYGILGGEKGKIKNQREKKKRDKGSFQFSLNGGGGGR
ncbi:MAG: response regulator [Deltaproteobacteria bacterium]|nr:response regulator [Deltaproteobacteria bacterium]